MIWLERCLWLGALLALLMCLAWASLNEPLLPDADDCKARQKPADCWIYSDPTKNVDVRSEPRP